MRLSVKVFLLIFPSMLVTSVVLALMTAARGVSSIVLLSVCIVIAVHATLYIAFLKLILHPIQSLTRMSAMIASGNYTIRSQITSADEVGELADAFNHMAQSMQQVNAELENKVTQKTEELAIKITEMQEQNHMLEKTKRAMLNLLEDARELEEKLKLEKSSVEEKVIERTKQFNEEAARLQASINSLNIGLIMTNVHNQITIMNAAARQILLSNNPTQSPSSESSTNEHTDIDISRIQSLFSGTFDLLSQIKLCLRDRKSIEIGEVSYGSRFLHLYLVPIIASGDRHALEGEVIGVIIVINDITEQKAIDRSKDEFFSIASHELRTPLTAIRGNTSLIQQYCLDKSQDKELKEMVNDIHESSIRLIGIVNDFLNTSRLEMGKMEFKKEPVDMVSLVNDVIKEYMTTGSMKKLSLELDPKPSAIPLVIGDKDRIKQVLINLVGNSLKFTEKGGVTIRLETKAGSVVTFVHDTGRGIPLENQSLLFRRFQQAGSSLFTRDTVHGTGLGLYISKMMIEGMNGKIWLASSDEGKGTTFAFSMPVAS